MSPGEGANVKDVSFGGLSSSPVDTPPSGGADRLENEPETFLWRGNSEYLLQISQECVYGCPEICI